MHISHKNYFPLKTQGLRHDPQLSFKHLPKTQADTICLRIKCTSAQTDTFQIYFKTEDPANPGKKVIGYVVIKVWPGRNDIALVFPSSILKNDFFRVDPGSQGSSFIFENITLNEYLEEENIQNVEKN